MKTIYENYIKFIVFGRYNVININVFFSGDISLLLFMDIVLKIIITLLYTFYLIFKNILNKYCLCILKKKKKIVILLIIIKIFVLKY